MRVGWDMTNVDVRDAGAFRHMIRWLEAIANFPGAHQHTVFAHQGFRAQATAPALAALDWQIVGDWCGRLQMRREHWFWRNRHELTNRIDLLVSLWNPPLAWNGPTIAVVLDTLPWTDGFCGVRKHLQTVFIRHGLRSASRWLVTTRFTRNALETLGVSRVPIDVAGIPFCSKAENAATPEELPGTLQQMPYVFYCSAICKRKNHIRLIQAWRQAFPNQEITLVLAGRMLPGAPPAIMQAIRDAEASGHVMYLGEISNSLRDALYQGAQFVVYPSLWEGFGMPVLEALSHGKAVLTSSGTAMEEVGAEAVACVNPLAVDQLAEGLQTLFYDSSSRERLVANAPLVLSGFQMSQIADELHQAIRGCQLG